MLVIVPVIHDKFGTVILSPKVIVSTVTLVNIWSTITKLLGIFTVPIFASSKCSFPVNTVEIGIVKSPVMSVLKKQLSGKVTPVPRTKSPSMLPSEKTDIGSTSLLGTIKSPIMFIRSKEFSIKVHVGSIVKSPVNVAS